MSKKNFKTGLDTLLGEVSEKPKVGRPRTKTREITKSSQEGVEENYTRATFIVNEESLEKIKSIAYWERRTIKDVVEEALEGWLATYIKKNGEPKPRPEGK